MLELARACFETLDSSGIRYCHWKSNSHLEQALNGKTDLDLLVHHEDEASFRQCLEKFPFIEMQSPWTKTFPFIEDYLGFDEQSGRQIHLHVHYRLVLGQRFIKNHHLPMESLYWANLTRDQGIAIPVPELELLMLVIRAAMKLSALEVLKQTLRGVLHRKGTPFAQGIEQELHYLLRIARREKLLEFLAESRLPLAPERVLGFLDSVRDDSAGPLDYVVFKRHVLRRLRPYRRHPVFETLPRYLAASLGEWPPLKMHLPSQRKTLLRRGFAVAVVGADGSGKSTLTADLRKWLSWKLDVRGHYYGIPKSGAITLLRFLERAANALPLARLRDVVPAMMWTFVAGKREKTSVAVEQDCAAGRVAIIDRFPHPAFASMARPMDGPQLAGTTGWPGRLLAAREAAHYRQIRRPDLILVLKAPVEVLRSRKTNLPLDTHAAKAEAVMAMSEDSATVALDAALPYAEVLLQAERIIGDRLVARERAHG